MSSPFYIRESDALKVMLQQDVMLQLRKEIKELKTASMNLLIQEKGFDSFKNKPNREIGDLNRDADNSVLQKGRSYSLQEELSGDIFDLRTIQKKILAQHDLLELGLDIRTKELLRKEKFAIVGKLAASIAHDLKNPLSIIRNDIKILKKKLGADYNCSKYTYNSFQRIDKSVLRMSHEIEDVMELVRMGPLKIDRFSVLKLIKTAINDVPPPKNVTIKFPQKDEEIECDSYKMERVFVNLLSNSYDAIGGKSGKIEFRFGGTKNVKIELEDTGPPVPEEDLQLVFEPFFTTKQNGTGLGLLSCKNIIEQHGGVINVQANPTIFTIVMPKKSSWYQLRF